MVRNAHADPQVVILAAGEGTRLRPLTIGRPKALVPVANVSLLARLLAALDDAGLRRAVVTLPPLGSEVQREVLQQVRPGFDLRTFTPFRPYEGSFRQVMELLDPEARAVLVIYGDSLLSLDFRALVDAHAAGRSAGRMATVLAHSPDDLRIPEQNGRTYHGVMELDGSSRIKSFVEKPRVEDIAPSGVANAAVFICERELLEHPRFATAADFSYDVFQVATAENVAPLHACGIGAGFRYDVGTVSRFFDVNMRALRGDIACAIPGRESKNGIWTGDDAMTEDGAAIDPPVILGRGVRVGPGARVGPNVVVGDGCDIEANAVVRDAVILANSRVGAAASVDTCVLGANASVGAGVALPPFTILGAHDVAGGAKWPI